MNEILSWLHDELERAKRNAAETGSTAPNSYGHGYDNGYGDALLAVREQLASSTFSSQERNTP